MICVIYAVMLLYTAHDLKDSSTFWGTAHTTDNIRKENISGFEPETFSKTLYLETGNHPMTTSEATSLSRMLP